MCPEPGVEPRSVSLLSDAGPGTRTDTVFVWLRTARDARAGGESRSQGISGVSGAEAVITLGGKYSRGGKVVFVRRYEMAVICNVILLATQRNSRLRFYSVFVSIRHRLEK